MNDDQRDQVGERLQEIRGLRDQRTFAEAVDSVQQTISKYERGEIPRSWLFLARLAEEEGIDLNFLLTGERLESEEPADTGGPGGSGHGGAANGGTTNGGTTNGGTTNGNGHGHGPSSPSVAGKREARASYS